MKPVVMWAAVRKSDGCVMEWVIERKKALAEEAWQRHYGTHIKIQDVWEIRKISVTVLPKKAEVSR